MKIIITLPAYNEENTIGSTIDEINLVMKKTKYKYIIHVLDDGSKDRTSEIAKSKGALVHKHKRNLGLAEAFRSEMQECLKLKADIIVHTDSDGQYDPTTIPVMVEKVLEGYDLVLGSRFKGKIQSMPLMKRLGNIAFSLTLSQLTGKTLTDTTTGYRAFTREVAENISYINTFTYTQEQIIRAAKQKFKIIEVPIYARKTRESRLFKSPMQYAIKAWINILRIYRDYDPLKFFGSIGLTFFSIGFLIGSWLVWLFLSTGQVGHYPSIILSSLLMITGVQIIIFGFFADMQVR